MKTSSFPLNFWNRISVLWRALIWAGGGALLMLAPAITISGQSDDRYVFETLKAVGVNREGHTFRSPAGLAVDRSGNVYVADTDNHAVYKVSPSGTTTVLAGAP